LRILHFSDPHFSVELKKVPLKKWFGKRAVGAINLLRGRGEKFAHAKEKIRALSRFKEQNDIDLTICTGDYTAFGLEMEIKNASKIISAIAKPEDRFITVPGNHDIYLPDTLKKGSFNRYFGKFMRSDLPQFKVDDFFPFVRIFDEVAVVGLNSARPNPMPWSSNGYIPQEQLRAFEEILDSSILDDKFIFVITHYAPRTWNGLDDKKRHSLLNADEFLKSCKKIKKGAILTGHIHRAFGIRLLKDGLELPLFCAGSISMRGRESFWLFDVDLKSCKVKQGFFKDGEFHTKSFELQF
jgi:3',5'-cyclic AMP phosphodiesterase CpdA